MSDYVARAQAIASAQHELSRRPEQFALVTIREDAAWVTSLGTATELAPAVYQLLVAILAGTGEDVERPE